MTFVDIHSHMDWNSLKENIEEIIEEMKTNNIITLSNTISQKNYNETKNLFKNYEKTIKVCPGLYPQDAEKIEDTDFENYLKQIKKENPIAIGEIGLDFHHTTDLRLFEIQKKRFKQLIEFAYKIDKHIIVHTRKAEVVVLEILAEFKQKNQMPKVCLHCFSGKKKLISQIKELGLYCSIPLTILNTQSFKILVEQLPIKSLLVETDSPFLNPSKKINTPLNIPKIYEEIAKIKGLNKTEIENIIYRNYMKFIM